MRAATPTGEEPSDEILHHETSLGAENSECCIHLFTAGGGERGGGAYIRVCLKNRAGVPRDGGGGD